MDRPRRTALLVVLAATLAACGGSGASSPASTPRGTDFLARAIHWGETAGYTLTCGEYTAQDQGSQRDAAATMLTALRALEAGSSPPPSTVAAFRGALVNRCSAPTCDDPDDFCSTARLQEVAANEYVVGHETYKP